MGRCADAEPPASKQAKLASLLSRHPPKHIHPRAHNTLDSTVTSPARSRSRSETAGTQARCYLACLYSSSIAAPTTCLAAASACI